MTNMRGILFGFSVSALLFVGAVFSEFMNKFVADFFHNAPTSTGLPTMLFVGGLVSSGITVIFAILPYLTSR